MPKNIIQNADDFLQIIKKVFPKKVHKLLEFGFKVLSLRPIKSLNSNARSVLENKHTAESKIYRKGDIQGIYYYRFEIEELFKDTKSLFGLEYIHFQKKHNFETTLWFVILGFWLQHYFEKGIKDIKAVRVRLIIG